jgi:hypothetical protein
VKDTIDGRDINDCRVVAETEFAGLEVLLSSDRRLRRLQPFTTIKILRPSEFWRSLGITRKPETFLAPASENPNYGKAWFEFPGQPQV